MAASHFLKGYLILRNMNSIHTPFLCQNENSEHRLRNVFNVAIFLLNQFNENDIHLEEEKLLAVSNLSVIGEFLSLQEGSCFYKHLLSTMINMVIEKKRKKNLQ